MNLSQDGGTSKTRRSSRPYCINRNSCMVTFTESVLLAADWSVIAQGRGAGGLALVLDIHVDLEGFTGNISRTGEIFVLGTARGKDGRTEEPLKRIFDGFTSPWVIS